MYICTINSNRYSIRRDVDRRKYILFKNRDIIAAIVRVEYENWKGKQVKFRPFSTPAELDYLDADGHIALEEAITYLNECGT